MSVPIYLGLDTATTMGLAVWSPDTHQAFVRSCKGGPIEQMVFIEEVYRSIQKQNRFADITVAFEELHHFRNAKTLKMNSERYGYLKYSLLLHDVKVTEVHPGTARSYIKCKDKEGVFKKLIGYVKGSAPITDDHTDALAVALKQAHYDGHGLDWDRLVILGGL